jgi:hypothetical protein
MSKRKSGWRPQLAVDTKTKKARRNACMVTNGKSAILVELESGDMDDRTIDEALEVKTLNMIKALEERDSNIMFREVIIFSAIANAAINQSLFFLPLVEHKAKQRLNSFKTDTEVFVKTIQKEAIGVHGDQMEQLLDNLEDATHRTFQKFGDAIIKGKIPEFINLIESF